MKQHYIVAQNVFSVSVPDGFPAWEAVKRRFMPFASSRPEKPAFTVNIQCRPLPENTGELIYETEYDGIGFITATASRLPDGSLIMEFRHIEEASPRLWLKMPPQLDNADIVLAPDGDSNDSYFLSHALMIAYLLATCGNGTLLMHASTVVYDGKAYLFQGKSGTGKSTHAALWIANIAGAELLNDDHPVVRFSDAGVATAYGSPWSGKTHCYRNESAPVGAFVRIVRDSRNSLRPLAPLNAYASLTASVFFLPFMNDRIKETRHNTIEGLAATVPCCEMHCRPDADAAFTCMKGLTIN